MIIAIDFDGTIVEHKMPEIGKLRPNAKRVINALYDQGHEIVIWTCRYLPEHLREMQDFLDAVGILCHAINTNAPSCDYACAPKVYADVYIDDRQLGGIPEDWAEIYHKLVRQFDLPVRFV